MVYVEQNHPAIVSKAMFYQVREEMSRRASKRKVMQKTGKTEQGKYSAKYALSELLVCGECGTPYKRCISVRIKPEWEVLPKRWIVERSLAWSNNSRRLSKDYELSVCSAQAVCTIAAFRTLLKWF